MSFKLLDLTFFFLNDEAKELEKEYFLTNDAISGDFFTPSLEKEGPGWTK